MTDGPLPDDFTRADVAHLVNSVVFIGYIAAALIVFALAILIFRGK